MGAATIFIKVKIDTPKEVVTDGGIIIPLDQGAGYAGIKNYSPQKYAPTHGVVVSKGGYNSGIEIGDTVMFHYNTQETCRQLGRLEITDGITYFYIEYTRVVCIRRGESLLPTNGWIICEYCEKPAEITSGGLHIPEIARKKRDNKFRVVSVHDGYEDCVVGDIIYTERECDRPLESNDIMGITSGELFKVETKDVVAIESHI